MPFADGKGTAKPVASSPLDHMAVNIVSQAAIKVNRDFKQAHGPVRCIGRPNAQGISRARRNLNNSLHQSAKDRHNQSRAGGVGLMPLLGGKSPKHLSIRLDIKQLSGLTLPAHSSG
jgi:hypothetical protein